MTATEPTPHIGLLNEHSLHAALKQWLAQPADRFEVRLGRYVVDVLRDNRVVEIQTSQLKRLEKKLVALTAGYTVTLVYPLVAKRWLIRPTLLGSSSKRLSPKKQGWLDAFAELLYCPTLLTLPNLTIQLLLVETEQLQTPTKSPGWRNKRWAIQDTRLCNVLASRSFAQPSDWLQLLPNDLPDLFSSTVLAQQLACSTTVARQLLYTFWRTGWLVRTGKLQRAWCYQRA